MKPEYVGVIFDVLTETILYRSVITYGTLDEAIADAFSHIGNLSDEEFGMDDCYVIINGMLYDAVGEPYIPDTNMCL